MSRGLEHHDCDSSHLREQYQSGEVHAMVVEEVTEIVDLQAPETMFRGENSDSSNCSSVDENTVPPLPRVVQEQLRLFVTMIASMYHTKNPFHCFEHATHVTCSAYQLLRRVIAKDLPDIMSLQDSAWVDPWKELPEFMGVDRAPSSVLTSDALAQFAIVFSALVHDVDHFGVPNTQLAKEKPAVAAKYQNRSLAEQTSVNLALEQLHQEVFHDLRACIFPSRKEFIRFRKMVINIVMSTDIADANLRAFRERKWEKAFGGPSMHQTMEARVEQSKEDRNRKATVMMDLIMMASDISHTMQPFKVYCEWNERLFREMRSAYREGRSEKDPSEGWYQGEMFFYDKHIIPLAQRLQDSGMFGPAADAMLEHAQSNRRLWQERGQHILADMKQRLDEPEICAQNPELAEQVSEEVPPTPSQQNGTLLGGFLSLCCQGKLPLYLQKYGSSQDEYYEEEEEIGTPLAQKKLTALSGDEDTLAESDEDESFGFSAERGHERSKNRGGWTNLYLRSRAKQS